MIMAFKSREIILIILLAVISVAWVFTIRRVRNLLLVLEARQNKYQRQSTKQNHGSPKKGYTHQE